MKKIYIILSCSGTKVARTLSFFTKYEYCHVSISFDENIDTMYSFGRKKVNNPFCGGFIEEKPNKGMNKKYDPKCKIIELSIDDGQYIKIYEMVKFFTNYKNCFKYNYFGLFYTFFGISKELNNRYTCTQFVASILNKSGIELNKDESLFIAKDYLSLNNIKVKYIGTINAYNKLANEKYKE